MHGLGHFTNLDTVDKRLVNVYLNAQPRKPASLPIDNMRVYPKLRPYDAPNFLKDGWIIELNKELR